MSTLTLGPGTLPSGATATQPSANITTTTAGPNADPHVLTPPPCPFTYLLIPRSRVLLEKLIGSQLVKKCPSFYGTQMFITALQVQPPVPILSQIDPVHAAHLTSEDPTLTLSCHLRLGLPRGLIPEGSPSKRRKHHFPPPYVLHVPPNSFFSIRSPDNIW